MTRPSTDPRRIEVWVAMADHCPGTLRWLRYRIRVHFLHGVWGAIERCMEALQREEICSARERLARDLAFLARQQFDFCPSPVSALGCTDRERIRSLYPEPFRRVIAPALVPGESQVGDARILGAFGEETRP